MVPPHTKSQISQHKKIMKPSLLVSLPFATSSIQPPNRHATQIKMNASKLTLKISINQSESTDTGDLPSCKVSIPSPNKGWSSHGQPSRGRDTDMEFPEIEIAGGLDNVSCEPSEMDIPAEDDAQALSDPFGLNNVDYELLSVTSGSTTQPIQEALKCCVCG